MIVVAITGGIGSGKSSVTRMLGELGAHTIDSDALVKEISENDPVVLAGLFELFAVNGILTRENVAAVAFKDPVKRRQMEELFHPRVFGRIVSDIAAIENQDPDATVVVEVPLLAEIGWKVFDNVIVVTCDDEVAIARATARGFIKSAGTQSMEEVEADMRRRKAIQATDDQRLKCGKYVIAIDNSGDSFDELLEKVEVLWSGINSLSHGAKSEMLTLTN